MTEQVIRADWGRVSLGEFDALSILQHDDPLGLINAYWDYVWKLPENVFRDESPTRLSESGLEWFDGLVRTVRGTQDEHDLIRCASDLISGLGLLTIVGCAKALRGKEVYQ